MSTSAGNRPPRMYAAGRPAIQDFWPEERLYFRVCRTDAAGRPCETAGKLNIGAIRAKNQSVNRSRFSKPEDVLIPPTDRPEADFSQWGFASVAVQDLPVQLRSIPDSNPSYSYRPVHDPLPDNYAHSEIRAYNDQTAAVHPQGGPRAVSRKYRTIMAHLAVVHRRPAQ